MMSNTIPPGGGQPSPTHGATVAQSANGKDAGAASFLALLALLGRGGADAGDLSPVTGMDANDGLAASSEPGAGAVPSATRQVGKAGQHGDGRRHFPTGAVEAHPILPAPVIIGAMPTLGTQTGWRATATDLGAGMRSAHPILPDALSPREASAGPTAGASPPDALWTSGAVTSATTHDTQGYDDQVSSVAKAIGKTMPDPSLTAPQGPNAEGNANQGNMPFLAGAPLPFAPPLAHDAPAAMRPVMDVGAAPPAADAAQPLPTASAPSKRHSSDVDGAASEDGAFALPEGSITATSGTLGGTPAPTATHPAVVNATREIVLQAQLVQRGQAAEMRLRLRPPDLGEVGVTVRRDAAGGLSVHLNPASREAAAVLQAHLPHLQTALEPHSQGQGAHVTLGQHDASSGSSHRQGGHENGRGDEETRQPVSAPEAARPAANTRAARRTALDYDA